MFMLKVFIARAVILNTARKNKTFCIIYYLIKWKRAINTQLEDTYVKFSKKKCFIRDFLRQYNGCCRQYQHQPVLSSSNVNKFLKLSIFLKFETFRSQGTKSMFSCKAESPKKILYSQGIFHKVAKINSHVHVALYFMLWQKKR